MTLGGKRQPKQPKTTWRSGKRMSLLIKKEHLGICQQQMSTLLSHFIFSCLSKRQICNGSHTNGRFYYDLIFRCWQRKNMFCHCTQWATNLSTVFHFSRCLVEGWELSAGLTPGKCHWFQLNYSFIGAIKRRLRAFSFLLPSWPHTQVLLTFLAKQGENKCINM